MPKSVSKGKKDNKTQKLKKEEEPKKTAKKTTTSTKADTSRTKKTTTKKSTTKTTKKAVEKKQAKKPTRANTRTTKKTVNKKVKKISEEPEEIIEDEELEEEELDDEELEIEEEPEDLMQDEEMEDQDDDEDEEDDDEEDEDEEEVIEVKPKAKKGSKIKVDNNVSGEIKEKLKYLGLDLDNIPAILTDFKPLNFRAIKGYEENKHRQYRFISPKDIEILLSPTNRLSDIEEKYSKASPIYSYLVPEEEEDIIKHTTFLNMLSKVKIEDIEKIEEEQRNLNKRIPFKVKYPGNYLWQIYYSENTNRYFMIVPTEDSEYSAFFYLLKKQLEKKKAGKIFVPISHIDYSGEYLRRQELEDIENYLWLFTKDWPMVYEVFDKKDELNIQIVGETEVYEKIKTPYKINLTTKEECIKFYKLVKALFIMQTELPHYYSFQTNIDKQGGLEFYFEDKKIEYDELADFIKEQCIKIEDRTEQMQSDSERLQKKLEDLKITAFELEMEYFAKEKQISTFLECKKTFFGKVKYFFKYNKKSKDDGIKRKIEEIKNEKLEDARDDITEEKRRYTKRNYTIEELIEKGKECYDIQNQKKSLVMDINALKLKNKNMAKRIENAASYIEEIDNHKKSIFEFWKYSNKDEVSSLAEGEAEELTEMKKISKVFDYEHDLKAFGETLDKIERKNLTKRELDSVYITTTNVLKMLNKIKANKTTTQDLEDCIKELKEEAKEEQGWLEKEEFDIFGGRDSNKTRALANKKHREYQRDKFKILDINNSTKQANFKISLEEVLENVYKALSKVSVTEDIQVYKAVIEDNVYKSLLNVFNLNPEQEVYDAVKQEGSRINLYKVNILRNFNAIPFTNIVFYENNNRTLPEGMDLSTKILCDFEQVQLEPKSKKTFRIIDIPKEEDFLDVKIKTVNVVEYDVKEYDGEYEEDYEENEEEE